MKHSEVENINKLLNECSSKSVSVLLKETEESGVNAIQAGVNSCVNKIKGMSKKHKVQIKTNLEAIRSDINKKLVMMRKRDKVEKDFNLKSVSPLLRSNMMENTTDFHKDYFVLMTEFASGLKGHQSKNPWLKVEDVLAPFLSIELK